MTNHPSVKSLLLASALALGGSAAAHAQDDAVSWTGPYIGLHAGGSLNSSPVTTRGVLPANAANVTANARPPAVVLDRNGPLGGAQAGYNIQFGRFVGGLEADVSALDTNDSEIYASPQTFGATGAGTRSYISAKTNYLATGRGRLGFLVSPRFLIYGTGGYATGDVKYRANFANTAGALAFTGAKSYDAAGYAAGGGVEYALPTRIGFLGNSAVTLRAEYLHYDLGKKQVNVGAVPNVGAGGYVSNFKTLGDEMRMAVNFKF